MGGQAVMKILIIITGIWIIFTITGILTYGFKKTFAVNRWLFVIVGLGLFGILTEWILFFPAWWLRDKKFNLFWFWMDDSRLSSVRESGYSEDYEIHLEGKKETMRTAYGWHMRNRVWNLDSLFKPKKQTILLGNQNIKVVEFIYDNLHKFDIESTKIKQDGIYEIMAGLKYWSGGVSTWNTNNGNMISIEKSILGKGFIWYKVGNWFGFRYSSCFYKEFWFIKFKWYVVPIIYKWKGWRTLKFGTNSKRFLFSIKFQKNKVWQ